jgi:hypothetical protein
MRANPELYKGIEFVRLSSLPKEQKKLILNSSYAKNTIKILHGDELFADCLPYAYYLNWHQECYNSKAEATPSTSPEIKALKLAFK